MSPWMALALAIIVTGGLAILLRLRLIGLAIGFWIAFAAGIGVIALAGHAMTARWHLGPITGGYFWWVLVTSPEILVFLFFMLTDPKTIPAGRVARIVYAVGVGLLSTLLIAPQRTEFASKVAVLGALALACAARPVLDWVLPAAGSPDDRLAAWVARLVARGRTGAAKLGTAGLAGAAAFAGLLVLAGLPARPGNALAAPLVDVGHLPKVTILHSSGVASQLDRKTALTIARSLVADLRNGAKALRTRNARLASPGSCCAALTSVQKLIGHSRGQTITASTYRLDRMKVKLRPAEGQGEPVVVAAVTGVVQQSVYGGVPPKLVRRSASVPFAGTFQLDRGSRGFELISFTGTEPPAVTATPTNLLVAKSFDGVHLQDVASEVGLNFRQDDFRYGVSNDVHSMMGGGLCWLDYNNDGWMDLFVVNSYSDSDIGHWNGHFPQSALYENIHGHFRNVTKTSHAGVATQGNGCVAVDLGNGYPSLFITTNTYNILLWNNGNGTFTNITHEAGIDAFGTYGWHTGVAVADVNGDGRPDIFVSGYADVNAPLENAYGFPRSYQAFRDLLYLNEGPDKHGHPRFKDVSLAAGIEAKHVDHSLGAVFTDVNGDGRPDLYVANDLDPNRLYINERGGPLGFHFVEEGSRYGVADRNAGMGIAAQDYSGDGRPDLFVTDSRTQGHAAFRSAATPSFSNVGSVFARAIGANGTGWGDSWVDLANNGRLDLVLANGAIPVTNLRADAGHIQVLENTGTGFADASAAVGLRPGPLVNGRGLAAADYDNDGRVDIAVNSIGGRLILLHNTGASGHWLEVSLAKFAPGALVTAVLPNGHRLVQEVHAGSSYLSSEDPRVHFGLGSATRLEALIVRWPGGKVTRLANVAADQILTVGP